MIRTFVLLTSLCLLVACNRDRDEASVDGPDCGLLLYCNCKDGATSTVSCGGSCADFCTAHGGEEPLGLCAVGETNCFGQCLSSASLSTDSNNCGACGNPCTEYTQCVAGKCTPDLPATGTFACRKDGDCAASEACVLNPAANCPQGPFCAHVCDGDGGTCLDNGTCSAAIDVGTSASRMACIATNDCS